MSNIDFESARIAMVDRQIRPADVTHYHIIECMLKVPREKFFPEKLKQIAYSGEHIQIGVGRYSLDPRVIAKILNLINIKENELVLDIGSGYGYAATLLSNFAQAVVMVEEVEYAKEAERILTEESIDNVIVRSGALSDGAVEHGPYDAIIIEGAVEVIPNSLLNQVKIGGRIAAIFMAEMVGECRVGLRTASGVNWRFAFNASAPVLQGFQKEERFVF
jgi:protein-L-isoaspartate(D-aspartate) O-methyltransferase